MHLPPHFAVNQAQPVIREYTWELSGLQGERLVFDSGENSPRFPSERYWSVYCTFQLRNLGISLPPLARDCRNPHSLKKLSCMLNSHCIERLTCAKLSFVLVAQLLSPVQLFVTPWTAACQASLSITNSRSLLRLMSIDSAWLVGDAIQPSHLLSSPSPPALNLSQHQGLFQWVGSSHQVTKVLELQLQHQSSQWIVRTDFL